MKGSILPKPCVPSGSRGGGLVSRASGVVVRTLSYVCKGGEFRIALMARNKDGVR
jgi:hypothetical protein